MAMTTYYPYQIKITYFDETKKRALNTQTANASTRQNLSSGFSTGQESNQSPQLQKLARKLKFRPLDMILFKQRITKTLISLRVHAGWSSLLLFANPRSQVFSRQGPVLIQGGGGGGGTLIFSYIRRIGSFFLVQNFEFQYFWGFSEKLL